MKLARMHWVGIIAGLVVLVINSVLYFIYKDFNLFLFLMGITAGIFILPFVIGVAVENKREQEISGMFLEFSRNLAESVTTGTPISKSILNMSKKNYGPLTPYIKKLANQISLGIPVNKAMRNFSREVDNKVISRAIALISEAERAGGEISKILQSVAESIAEVEKLKKERKAAIFNLVVQGYIIFFIFVGIMLVMEFKILPLTTGLGGMGGFSGSSLSGLGEISTTGISIDPSALARPFLYLLLTQGIFAGLTIGKLSEGTIRAGIKHSFILTIMAFLISTGARTFLS